MLLIQLASPSTTKGRGSYEGKNLKDIVNEANKALQGDNKIAKVYGKGGYTPYKPKGTPLARNVSLVVELDNDEKFIFTMYVNSAEGIKPNKDKEDLNQLIGQKLAEAIGDQGLNESLNEQESSGDYMDSKKAYQLVDYAHDKASNIFLGSDLITQIRRWAKKNK